MMVPGRKYNIAVLAEFGIMEDIMETEEYRYDPRQYAEINIGYISAFNQARLSAIENGG